MDPQLADELLKFVCRDGEPQPSRLQPRAPMRPGSVRLPLVLVIFFAFSCLASTPARTSSSSAGVEHQEDAQQLVRDVVYNEIQAQVKDTRHWRFHETQWKDTARKLYDVIQTKYGDLHRLLAIDGKPLKGNALEAENQRIEQLSSDPSVIEAEQKKRDADAKQERTLLRMLPNAFIFHRVGQSGNAVKLSFAPDPSFHPSTREAEVFHHMEGTMLVDGASKRLLQIDGRLMSPVNFWGGILGHLDAGGTFKVEQREVADNHWDTVFLHVDMNGKALFFKTISVHQFETYSDYSRVPDDLSPEQAARELQQDVESSGHEAGN